MCVLSLLYVSLDTVVLLPPLYRCVSVGEGGDEGQEIDPKLDIWIQPPWDFGNVWVPCWAIELWVLGALMLATGEIHKTNRAVGLQLMPNTEASQTISVMYCYLLVKSKSEIVLPLEVLHGACNSRACLGMTLCFLQPSFPSLTSTEWKV